MEQDQWDRIIERNPGIDPTAIERSRQAAEQLAEVGIELGGYHLSPPLGDMQSIPPGTFDQKLWQSRPTEPREPEISTAPHPG